ncbi:hypothetical protein BDD12DRAFT_916284 [Trichophaea hybrida]|nr:hypothetical protein BDD12DRAFT_916284 [Trichophaea hybrida]
MGSILRRLDWLDNIIFAMAPLGILTAIVAAIRVGGPSWLKAVVGRARENIATVELELMSSTSHEVCELWNGHGIVKSMGKPEVQQIIYLKNKKYTETKRGELYAAALCGIILQFGMLVFCGFSIYHPTFSQRFPKNGRPVQGYAFPIMALGTILLMLGMFICSAIVDQSTKEEEYAQPNDSNTTSTTTGLSAAAVYEPNIRLLWLQKSHTVSDQAFNSFVLFGQSTGRRDRILTSRRQGNKQAKPPPTWLEKIASNSVEAFTLLGVLFGLCGFILQFQGLRGMNWSASIAQLVCIFLMTIWRAWIRRGLIANPVAQRRVVDFGLEMSGRT